MIKHEETNGCLKSLLSPFNFKSKFTPFSLTRMVWKAGKEWVNKLDTGISAMFAIAMFQAWRNLPELAVVGYLFTKPELVPLAGLLSILLIHAVVDLAVAEVCVIGNTLKK